MIFEKMNNFMQRIAMSFVAIVATLTFVYFSFHPYLYFLFPLFLATSIACALWEYYHIAIVKHFEPLVLPSIVASGVYVFATFFVLQGMLSPLYPAIILALSFLAFCIYFLFKPSQPLVNLALTSFGIIYLTIPLTLILNINYYFGKSGVEDGRWWLLYMVAVTKMTDTGAYLIGKKFGKRKLALHISPKKTQEGAIGGLIFCLATSIFFAWFVGLQMTLTQSIVLGIAVGVIAQIGDLVESLLKRDGGIKDSSQWPGLGGMLDIVDSSLFVIPLIYFFLKFNF